MKCKTVLDEAEFQLKLKAFEGAFRGSAHTEPIGLHIYICTKLHKQDSNHKYPRLSSAVRILKS